MRHDEFNEPMDGIVYGVALFFWIGLLLENDGVSNHLQINTFLLLAVALSGLSGWMLFRSGLKAKKEFDASF